VSYAFDPNLAPWAALFQPIELENVQLGRARWREEALRQPPYEPPRPLRIRNLTVPGPTGAPDVPVRIYAPAQQVGELPGFLYLHGGAFCIGDLDVAHATVARVASEVGVVAIAVDYRLAPEHSFPAGVEDCYAALTWTAKYADELGIDTQRLGVGGESAGAGLAAALTLLARDRGGPALAFQYLDHPQLDDRLQTLSMRAFVDTPLNPRRTMELSWSLYLGERVVPGSTDVSLYAAPARADDLSGLPSAYVVTAEFDALRDEGIDYAQRLVQAGVHTELHLYPGTFHGSEFVAQAAVSKRMLADQLDAIRRGLRVTNT
jgi:acetyl esterase